MAAVGALGLAGGLLSAGGQLFGGFAQMQALNYQSQVAANNAAIAKQYAEQTAEATQIKTAAVSMQERAQLGAIKAGQAASGVDVNTGSAKAVQMSQRELGNLSAMTEMSKGQLAEYGYNVQAMNATAQSQLYAHEAPQALIGGALGAGGTALSAGAKWYSTS
jgi:hypothetical protein